MEGVSICTCAIVCVYRVGGGGWGGGICGKLRRENFIQDFINRE